MTALLATIGGALWTLLKPFIGPTLTYWKGRREGSANERAKAQRRYEDAVERASDARRRVDPDGVRNDEFNRDR